MFKSKIQILILISLFSGVFCRDSFNHRVGCSSVIITYVDQNTSEWKCTSYSYNKCFEGNTLVWTSNNTIPMNELVIGDEIHDADGNPTKVIGFTSHKTVLTTTIQFTSNGNIVREVSPYHIVYGMNGPDYATNFRSGDYLSTTTDELLVDVRYTTKRTELITPITSSGTMLVGENKIRASCYAHTKWLRTLHYYTKIRNTLFSYNKSTSSLEKYVTRFLKFVGLAN